MLRMPQVGERWRLVPRPAELMPNPCGCVPYWSERYTQQYGGEVYEVVPAQTMTECLRCGDISVTDEGWVAVAGNGLPSCGTLVPYTWLEPVLGAEALRVR